MFGTVDKAVMFALFLVLVYLLVTNPDGVKNIINSLGGYSSGVLGTLQGRTVKGFDVEVGGLAAGSSTGSRLRAATGFINRPSF